MIDNLKALAAVIDSKSLTKAASRLFLTQSAISRRIQQLEELISSRFRGKSETLLG
jgi:DNA-binding transcriptional LysR family regulator